MTGQKTLAVRGMDPESLSPSERRLLTTMFGKDRTLRFIRREDPSYGPWMEEYKRLNVQAVVTFSRREGMRIRIFGPEPRDTLVFCHPAGMYTMTRLPLPLYA